MAVLKLFVGAAWLTATGSAFALQTRTAGPLSGGAVRRRHRGRCAAQAATSMSGNDELVVVIGAKDGVADALASRLGSNVDGLRCRAVFEGAETGLDIWGSSGSSDSSEEDSGFNLFGGGGDQMLSSAIQGASYVVIAPDSPHTGAEAGVSPKFLSGAARALKGASGVKGVYCVLPASEASTDLKSGSGGEDTNGGVGLFGGVGMQLGPGSWATVRAAAQASGSNFYALAHGRLFGGVPGNEPLPFSTGPLKEPALDEHYVAGAVMLSRSNALVTATANNAIGESSMARTSRMALSETLFRLMLAEKSGNAGTIAKSFSVLSIDGGTPGDQEWSQQFDAVDDKKGMELLSVSFGEIINRRGLINWLTSRWGPGMLQKLTTYTKRTGSRPVIVRQTEAGATIRWENLLPDNTVQCVGQLEIRVSSSTNTLSLVRVDVNGRPISQALPAEDEIVQRLLEGIETTVYSKKYATRFGFVAEPEVEEVVAVAAAAPAPTPAASASPEAVPWKDSPDYDPSATAPAPSDSAAPAPSTPSVPRRKKRSQL